MQMQGEWAGGAEPAGHTLSSELQTVYCLAAFHSKQAVARYDMLCKQGFTVAQKNTKCLYAEVSIFSC